MDGALDALRGLLRDYRRAVVAFSGGVDSSFLLRVAADEIPGGVVALTVRSPTAAPAELRRALDLASELGVEHVVVDSNELDIPGYADNPANRCYFCKDHLFAHCRAEADRRGISVVLDGVNADDLTDYRPGLKAAHEHSVRHPLAELGLAKDDIRTLSRELGLTTWDQPASPCLSSRFPYGTRITPSGLHQVSEAESVLHRLGFATCRVRFHGEIARIEVPVDRLPRLLDEEIRAAILAALQPLGFRYVTVDLRGFRSGSLNEALPGR